MSDAINSEWGDSAPVDHSEWVSKRIAALERENSRLTDQLEFQLNLVDKVQDERDALATRCRGLEAFANEILEHQHGSLDGCDIQDFAVKHGLLVKVEATEPCGDQCACAEFIFPLECYRRAALAASEPSTPADRQCAGCGAVLIAACECPHCGRAMQDQPK